MKRITAVLFALLLAVCPVVSADPALDRYVEARMAESRIPGMVVGYIRGDETVVRAYGRADLENSVAMTPEASFRLASLAKTMTAVAILQLVERGKIDLDAEVQRYVPSFPRKRWPVTIRQLLGHIGGISHYRNRAVEQHIKTRHTLAQTIDIFASFDLVSEPGTKYLYSTYGYALLAAAIEGASGEAYPIYMQRHIYAPLGMSSTREDDPTALIPRRVRGYQLSSGAVVNSEYVDVSTRVGGGGTRSTVPDMLRFVRALMNGQLLSKPSMELMFTSMQTRDGRFTDYAMGCTPLPGPAFDTNGRFAVTNNGGQPETRTFLMFFPKENAAFMTAMNFELNTDDSMFQRIAQTLFGEPLDFAPVTADGTDDRILRAVQQVFTLGVADRTAHPGRKYSEADVRKSLEYFNAIVRGTGPATALEDGRQPAAGEPLTILGRAMADALPANARTPERGALPFFEEAIRLRRLRFPRELESRITRWSADWQAATPPAVRTLVIAPDADFNAIGEQLRTTFRGRSVRPNLARRFSAVAEALFLRGDVTKAGQAAAVAVELYPASAASHVALALPRLIEGKVADARLLFARAEELERGGPAGAGRLNRLAYSLADVKRLADAIALLQIAGVLHPAEANLFDSLGEMHLRNGDRENARAAYRKALEVDPRLENAKEMLRQIDSGKP